MTSWLSGTTQLTNSIRLLSGNDNPYHLRCSSPYQAARQKASVGRRQVSDSSHALVIKDRIPHGNKAVRRNMGFPSERTRETLKRTNSFVK